MLDGNRNTKPCSRWSEMVVQVKGNIVARVLMINPFYNGRMALTMAALRIRPTRRSGEPPLPEKPFAEATRLSNRSRVEARR